MSYTVASHCEKCGHSDEFFIGNWKEHLGVFVCREQCHAMVNVPLDTRRCPGCDREVASEDCYDYAHSIPYFNGAFLVEPEPGPVCPNCNAAKLRFQPTIHHNMLMFACRHSDGSHRWLGKEYLEKEIFGHALVVACFELELDTQEAFRYFRLDQTPRMTARIQNFATTARGLSTPILFDIRTHLEIRLKTGAGIENPLQFGSTSN
jgi:hypothetical protein